MAGNSRANSGFTLIELVIVIAILDILGTVAIPKFFDISDDAHSASAKATHGGFSSALAALVPRPRVNLTRYHGVFIFIVFLVCIATVE